MDSKKILVTGAAGFIGSHTVDALISGGCTVVGVDNLRTGKRENLDSAMESGSFQLLINDITEQGFLNSLFAKWQFSAVIHLAGLVSVSEAEENPDLNDLLNRTATKMVADAAIQGGVARLVFSSSAAVYGDNINLPLCETEPTNPIGAYGIAKADSEKILLERADVLSSVILRYFNVFGPRQNPDSSYSGVISVFGDQLRRGEAATFFGDGEQTRDFISVSDVARANVAAALTPTETEICNVCTGRPSSLLNVWSAFSECFQSSLEPLRRERRENDILHSLGDPQKAMTVLGFKAETSLQKGIHSFAKSLATI